MDATAADHCGARDGQRIAVGIRAAVGVSSRRAAHQHGGREQCRTQAHGWSQVIVTVAGSTAGSAGCQGRRSTGRCRRRMSKLSGTDEPGVGRVGERPIAFQVSVPCAGPLATLKSRLDVAGLSTSSVSLASTPGARNVQRKAAATW